MENTPKAHTLSECIMELDNIRSIISEIVGLFRMASTDGNPDTFESTDLERLAYGSAEVHFVPTVTPKKRGRKPGTKVVRKDLRGILRPVQAAKFLGVSTATIYRWHNTLSGFPKRVSLGERSTGWVKSDLEEWLANKKSGVAA